MKVLDSPLVPLQDKDHGVTCPGHEAQTRNINENEHRCMQWDYRFVWYG